MAMDFTGEELRKNHSFERGAITKTLLQNNYYVIVFRGNKQLVNIGAGKRKDKIKNEYSTPRFQLL